MKKFLFVLLTAGLLFHTYTYAQVGEIDLKELDKYIENARSEWQIPGMAVAIVKDGEIVFAKGYGMRNLETNKKVDEHTLFAIASNSKAFTSAALSMLVDEGKLNWDDKVVKYLPWFELYDPYVTQNITVRDLLCHRSGLYTFSGDLLWYYTNYSKKEVVERAKYLEPRYGFREHYGYQNIMFSAAGLVLEEITGMSWEEYIEQHFFDVLNMSNSNTSVSQLNVDGNVAIPYHVTPDEEPIALNYLSWDNCAAAAAINSSVHDMAQWIKFQLNSGKLGEKQIISEEQIWETRKMHTPQPVSKYAFESQPLTKFKGYGLGWAIYDFNGKKVINHGGGSDGMISKVAMIPEENLGLVILTNSINYLPSALTNQIFDMYFGIEGDDWSEKYLAYYKNSVEREKQRITDLNENRIKNTKPSFDTEAYIGTYNDEAYGNIEIMKNAEGKLELHFDPAPGLIGDLEHYHYDVYTVKLRDNSLPIGTVQFFMNEKGEINKLKIDIPNPDFYFDEFSYTKVK